MNGLLRWPFRSRQRDWTLAALVLFILGFQLFFHAPPFFPTAPPSPSKSGSLSGSPSAKGLGSFLRRSLIQLRNRGQPLIEFAVAGNFIPLREALDLGLPHFPAENLTTEGMRRAHGIYATDRTELDPAEPHRRSSLLAAAAKAALQKAIDNRKKGLISEEDLRSALSAAVHARNATDLTARLAANHTEGLDNMYPDESPRMLVAVTSTCCGAESRAKRNSIRATWKARVLREFPNVHVRFVLAQPATPVDERDMKALESEVASTSDLILVRGPEKYDYLTSKTLGTLRFFYSSENMYTHLLKTDEDCYVRLHKVFEALEETLPPRESENGQPRTRRHKVYAGCLENRGGFAPIRDPNSKWYLSREELPDADVPWGVRYLAGWGYVLSRDTAEFVLRKVDRYLGGGGPRPTWWTSLHPPTGVLKWEDATIGLLASEYVGQPQDLTKYFRAAWHGCTNNTAVKHLDVDSPALLPGLYEQDVSGLWDAKTVQCTFGQYWAGDYRLWRRWRNSVAKPI